MGLVPAVRVRVIEINNLDRRHGWGCIGPQLSLKHPNINIGLENGR